MRTVALTKESTKDILENLLKRSPNNYGKFESAVDEILKNVQAALIREDTGEAIVQKGFDVRRQAVQMAEFYRTGKNPAGHITE